MSNNTLEFFVKMKDLMSGGLVKLAQNSQATFAKIQGHVRTAVDKTRFLSNSVDELREKLRKVNEVRFGTVMRSEFDTATRSARGLEHQISRLENRGRRGGSSGSSLRGMFGSLLPAIGLAAATSFGASTVHAAMDFQTSKTKYGVLTGSQKTGDELAGQLRGLKQNTIMGTSVYPAAEKMLGFGISANKVVPDLKMLGDVSMGDAAKLQRLTLAFSEVAAAGKLNGRRMLQFVNAGFNPLLEISRTTGMSMETLADKMKHGEISAAMLEGAFKSATSEGGRFNGMLEKVANTPLGRMKKLEGQFQSLKIDIGEALMPVAEFFMKTAKFLMEHKEMVFGLITMWGTYTAVTKVATFFQAMLNSTIMLNPIALLVIAIGGLIVGLYRTNHKTETWTESLKNLWAIAKDVTKLLITGFAQAFETIAYGAEYMWLKTRSILDQTRHWLLVSSTDDYTSPFAAQLKALKEHHNAISGKRGSAMQGLRDDIGSRWSKSNIVIQPGDTIVTAAGIKKKHKGEDSVDAAGGSGSGSVASSIASAGPRVVNIHMRDMVGKIEIHSTGTEAGLNNMEHRVEEHFLRILNSGASVQGN